MNRIERAASSAAALILLAGACSCATTASNQLAGRDADSVETTLRDSGFDRTVRLARSRTLDMNGLLEVHVWLESRTRRAVAFETMFEWFDETGLKIETPLEAWRPCQVDGFGTAEVRGIAPVKDAKAYRFHVRRPNPMY